MGTVMSADTRKISFKNHCSLPPVVPIESVNDNNMVDKVIPSRESFSDYSDRNSMISTRDDNEYWAKRIAILETEHKVINKIMQSEYEKTLKKTSKMFVTPKLTKEQIQKFKPCLDWRSKVLSCYEENPRQPLNCSKVVQAFSNCVSSCRTEV